MVIGEEAAGAEQDLGSLASVSSGDTRTLITQAVEQLQDEVPSLKQLKLVIRLELRARGALDLAGGGARTAGDQGPCRRYAHRRGDQPAAVQQAGRRGQPAAVGRGLRARPRAGDRRRRRDQAAGQRHPAPAGARERGAVVELDHAHRPGRRGVQAELAEHALVEVLGNDLDAVLADGEDVTGQASSSLRASSASSASAATSTAMKMPFSGPGPAFKQPPPAAP